jgi:hypothetical protein
MFGYVGEDSLKLAGAVEFIHAATLLHDNVIDESTMRRSKSTANVVWGIKSKSFSNYLRRRGLTACEIESAENY